MSDIEFLSDVACPVVALESLYSLRKNQFHGMEAMQNSMQAVTRVTTFVFCAGLTPEVKHTLS